MQGQTLRTQQKGPSSIDGPSALQTKPSGRLNHKIVRQLKANSRLRRNFNIPISRQAAQYRTAARSHQAADQQPNAPGGDAANQHAQAGAAADKCRGSLALALLRLLQIP